MKPELNVSNLDKLIARMRTLRPDQFNIKYLFSDAAGERTWIVPGEPSCGTAACIAGECGIVAGAAPDSNWDAVSAEQWLGLEFVQSDALFCPRRFYDKPELFPLPRAIDVLCHLRNTGEVRWDLFPVENYRGEPWAAPKAIELTPPALPDEITRLLGAGKVEA